MNFYDILKVKPDCTDAELNSSYESLKAKYKEDRFLEGEAGRIGALNLEELEKAYQSALTDREKLRKEEDHGGDLGEADAHVKANRLDEAQRVLDSIAVHSAKWHFLQSIIFYKRNWYVDSRNQLQCAISLDPENPQYRESMERLEKVISNENTPPEDLGTQRTAPPVGPEAGSMNMCANCCNTLCCASLCCDCVRCCG